MPDEKLYPMNIYDATGKVKRDLDPKEIGKCSKAQQVVLFEVLKSLPIVEKSEADAYEAVKATRRATTALDRSRKAYEDAMPKVTFHDTWLTDVAKQPPKPVSDATKKAIADALVGVEKAEKHLGECQRTEHTTRQDERARRAEFAKHSIAFSAIDGIPKSVGDLIKQRGAVERGIALKNIADGYPSDYSVAQASTVGPSHLDQFKSGQGKGHSANRGYGRNSMRGATLAPKAPSER
jgi:hypothetical protein